MKILGTRLKELRSKLNLSQVYVSKKLGIGQTTYAAYEIGRSQPGNEMLVKLAIYYEVSTDYLLGKSNTKYTQAELDFFNEIKEKGIEQLIHDYNLTLGSESLDLGEEKKLIKLIKLFIGSDE